ncbi:MAG: hypothetical protein IPM71_09065 [Bacteroidota bacterium]|nr:MAG: hypothetical protein IPM71_09065 [Bacteroidota bacterium]
MVFIARFLTYLFHPVFSPLIGLYLIYHTGVFVNPVPWNLEKFSYAIVLVFGILLPISLLPVLKFWRLIGNYEISERRERILPISLTAFCLIAMHIFMSRVMPVRVIIAFSLATATTSILLLFINVFHKTSMHMIGAGGITGLLLSISILFQVQPFFWLIAAILASGMLGSARLVLRAHTHAELLSGYFTGLIATLLVMLVSMR